MCLYWPGRYCSNYSESAENAAVMVATALFCRVRVLKWYCQCSESAVLPIAQNGLGLGLGLGGLTGFSPAGGPEFPPSCGSGPVAVAAGCGAAANHSVYHLLSQTRDPHAGTETAAENGSDFIRRGFHLPRWRPTAAYCIPSDGDLFRQPPMRGRTENTRNFSRASTSSLDDELSLRGSRG